MEFNHRGYKEEAEGEKMSRGQKVLRLVLIISGVGLGLLTHHITDSLWGLVIAIGGVLLGFMVGRIK